MHRPMISWHDQVMSSAHSERPVVIFDDACRVCTRSARLVRACDWLHRLDQMPRSDAVDRFADVDFDGVDGLRVRHASGHVTVGIDAVRSIMLRTPLGLVPGLLLFVPGVHWLGARFYGWFSRNRYRFGGTVTCSVPTAQQTSADAPTVSTVSDG